jgi:hypothetical protein
MKFSLSTDHKGLILDEKDRANRVPNILKIIPFTVDWMYTGLRAMKPERPRTESL